MRWRSHCGVSPVRRAVRMGASATPRSSARARISASGTFQVLVDVVAQRLERRNVDDLGLVRKRPEARAPHQASMAIRKAASVLPEPVGAEIRTSPPGANLRPAAQLRLGGLRETRGEPFGDQGIEAGEHQSHFRLVEKCYNRDEIFPFARLMPHGTGSGRLSPRFRQDRRSRNCRRRSDFRSRDSESKGRQRPGAVRHDRHRQPRQIPAEAPEEHPRRPLRGDLRHPGQTPSITA